MDIRKTVSAVIVATMVLSMTACANSEKPSGNGGVTMQTGSNSTNNSIPLIQDGEKEPAKELGIWDVLPEIPVTDASAFTYKYDSELGGMVVTDYLRESPKVRIPDKLEGEPVVEVDFRLCKKELTEVILPDTVKKLYLISKDSLQYINHPRDMEKLNFYEVNFNNCKNLEAVYIAEGVTSISYDAFRGCTSLTRVNIPNSVTKIGSEAFRGCASLSSVAIGNGVTSIGKEAFRGCTSLTNVTIGNEVTSIGEGAFYSCTSLASVTIPNGAVEIGVNAFSKTGLTSLTIPNSVTKIGSGAFYATPWLKSRQEENRFVVVNNILIDGETCSGDETIPDSVTAIGGGAFWDCTNLTSITIPNGVTQIDDSAFRKCRNLTNVTIPDSVTTIGDLAFYGCENIQATYKDKTYDYEHIEDLYEAINGN